MNAKRLFKIAVSTAMLVSLLLLGIQNRAPVDFSLLPMWDRSFHGPVALMYFAFFAAGVLMGLVISIRSGRKQTPSGDTITTSHEPRIGSRIS